MRSALTNLIATGLGILLTGCTKVPPLHQDGIAISDIVQRAKCEIAYAVPQPQPPYPTGPFQWMRNWTAKVDLTLITNAQAAVTPSVVLTKFFPTVLVPKVGSFMRNFTFGFGAGVDTRAVRTEILSFTVSLAELRKRKYRGDCNLPDGPRLYGHLGLQEWVASAVAPVEFGQLQVGRHPPPGSTSPPPFSVRPEIRSLEDPKLAQLKEHKDAVVHYAEIAKHHATAAERNGKRDDIQATYNDAARVYGAVAKAASAWRKANEEGIKLKKSDPHLEPKIKILLKEASDAAVLADKAQKDVDNAIEQLPRDPPIDSLSHSVQFVVALTGDVSPNWLLLNFNGPGVKGSFASGSYMTTHTLSIVMGSPAAKPELNRQLDNLVIIQNRGER